VKKLTQGALEGQVFLSGVGPMCSFASGLAGFLGAEREDEMRRLAATLAISATLLSSSSGGTEIYPSHPITMVVPFAAGGPMDVVARVVADGMRSALGQPVVIENVVGAGGSIGAGRAARAAADGFTIAYGGWPTHVINGAAYALSYDVIGDFEPVALVASAPWLILARNGMPADDLRALMSWLRSHPNTVSAGHGGVGSASHVFAALFQITCGTKFALVPYRGNAPAIQDLVAERIDLLFDSPATAMPHVQARRIKAYAVTAQSRLASAPGIPTATEAGLPDFEISSWHAIWAPKGTPKQIIDTLNRAVISALAEPAVRERLAALGQEIPAPDQQAPDALAHFQRAEVARWWPVIKAAGIKAQ
jgi:tripartite-type tricarboxylate transporter receptor subunit TctC